MTWSYSGNLATSNLDRLRFAIGDTDEQDPLFQDEELHYQLDTFKNVQAAATDCLVRLMAKTAREIEYQIGPEHVKAEERFNHYKDLYNIQVSAKGAIINHPIGYSISQQDRPFVFAIGMQDNDG